MLNTGILTAREVKKFQRVSLLESEEYEYGLSLKNLSDYLARYHQQKVIILIDEYDIPVQCGYLHGYYPQVIGFIRNLLSGAFKDNSNLEKGIMTGILRIAKESLFSGLNNPDVCTLMSTKYQYHFGLLEEEMETILKYYEIDYKIDEVKDWYNGYVFGENTIYNPWSIINYADKWNDGLLPYWVHTSSDDLMKRIITRSGRDSKKTLKNFTRGKRSGKRSMTMSFLVKLKTSPMPSGVIFSLGGI